jgi:hypothetical protein
MSCIQAKFNSTLGRLHWGELLNVTIGRAICETCSATWNLDTNSAFTLGPRKTTETVNEVGRSQELPNANWLLAGIKYGSPDISPYLCKIRNLRMTLHEAFFVTNQHVWNWKLAGKFCRERSMPNSLNLFNGTVADVTSHDRGRDGCAPPNTVWRNNILAVIRLYFYQFWLQQLPLSALPSQEHSNLLMKWTLMFLFYVSLALRYVVGLYSLK